MINRLSLALSRFCSAAWVGAATLFVITGISEVRSPDLDSATKDVIVLLRFPCYYTFGFSLVICAAVSLLIAIATGSRRKTDLIALILFAVCLAGMFADHAWVYTPLEEHIRRRGPRDATFISLHEASKWGNLATVSLCATASFLLCFRSKEQANSV